MNSKKDASSFEKNLSDLQTIVDQLEKEELSLEKAMECFEQGIKLTQLCQKSLQATEQKVKILLKKEGKDVLEDFHDATSE